MESLRIHISWARVLLPFFKSENWEKIKNFLESEVAQSTIYPPLPKVFQAFKLTPFENVSA